MSLLPEALCPSCGKKLDAATSAFGDHQPKSGDITICLYCGHLMVFGDDLKIRELNDKEIYDLAGDKTILKVQKARAEVMGKKRENQPCGDRSSS